MDWPERFLGERIGTEAVLIGHHHKLKVEFPTDEGKVGEHAFGETEFLKGIYLFVGWLMDEGAVTVDKQYFFHRDKLVWGVLDKV